MNNVFPPSSDAAKASRYRDLAYAVLASVAMAVLVAIPVAIAIVETAHG